MLLSLKVVLFLTISSTLLAVPSNTGISNRTREVLQEEGLRVPEKLGELSFEIFEQLVSRPDFNEVHVFPLARKYFPEGLRKNVTMPRFLDLAKEYIVEELQSLELDMKTLAKVLKLFKKGLKRHYSEQHEDSFGLKECWMSTVRGGFMREVKRYVDRDELPVEFRHRMEEWLEKFQIPEMHRGIEDFSSRKLSNRTEEEIKRDYLKSRFGREYGGIEWDLDGRRVNDSDYDDLEPAYERNIHKLRVRQYDINPEEVDEFLELDL